MKSLVLFFLMGLLGSGVMTSVSVCAAEPAKTPAKMTIVSTPAPIPFDPDYMPLPLGMLRGVVNVGTSPLELVRCVLYDGAVTPVFGLIQGVFSGTALTITRAMTGALDIVSFGSFGNFVHGKTLPTWIWQSRWFPQRQIYTNDTMVNQAIESR